MSCGRHIPGGVAEWLCSGLQSRGRRFDSDPRLQFERFSRSSGIFAGCRAGCLTYRLRSPDRGRNIKQAVNNTD